MLIPIAARRYIAENNLSHLNWKADAYDGQMGILVCKNANKYSFSFGVFINSRWIRISDSSVSHINGVICWAFP